MATLQNLETVKDNATNSHSYRMQKPTIAKLIAALRTYIGQEEDQSILFETYFQGSPIRIQIGLPNTSLEGLRVELNSLYAKTNRDAKQCEKLFGPIQRRGGSKYKA